MSRSDDLAAGLAADLAAEVEHARSDRQPLPVPRATPSPGDAQPAVEAALYLAPRTWQRPRISRARWSVTIAGGPLRVRIGRGSSRG